MSSQPLFPGVIPAIVSPCNDLSVFDEAAFASLAGRLFQRGAQGLYVCGLTGEGYQMSPAERRRAVELAVQAAGSAGRILAHVGTQDTRSACALAEHAATCGAHGIASIPPQGRPFAEIVDYYRDVSAAGGGLPVFIYHIPTFTKWEPSLDEFARLLEIDSVRGLKFTDYNLLLMRRILDLRPGLELLYGRDEQFAAALAFGATGGVGSTYNIMPGAYAAIYRAAQAGDWDQALKLQNALLDLFVVFEQFGVLASTEAVLALQGLAPRTRRAPSTPLGPAERERLWHKVRPLVAALGPEAALDFAS